MKSLQKDLRGCDTFLCQEVLEDIGHCYGDGHLGLTIHELFPWTCLLPVLCIGFSLVIIRTQGLKITFIRFTMQKRITKKSYHRVAITQFYLSSSNTGGGKSKSWSNREAPRGTRGVTGSRSTFPALYTMTTSKCNCSFPHEQSLLWFSWHNLYPILFHQLHFTLIHN